MRGFGSQSLATLPIRSQVNACFWLRRRSVRPPKPDDMVTERAKRPKVGRHGVVGTVASEDQLQPSPLLGNGLQHAPAQFVLDLPQLRPSAVPPIFATDLEPALPGPSADMSEAKEIERFRFAEPE